MTTTTADRIPIGSSSWPPQRPGAVRSIGPGEYRTLPVRQGHTEVESEAVAAEPSAVALMPAPGLASISVINDDLGQFVAQDTSGFVYGVGSTPQAAVADLLDVLDARLRFLRTNRSHLHPKLLAELGLLERRYPNR